jgi:acyl-coenzyme A synthetase/AMP-(fatty) acid ligase
VASASNSLVNLNLPLKETALRNPDGVAIVESLPRKGKDRRYRQVSFRELYEDTNCIAAGLQHMGARPGMRLVLLVRPSIDFIAVVMDLFKTCAVPVLVDHGLGSEKLLQCLEEVEPEGFVAIPIIHAVRQWYRRRFPGSHFNVTVGRRWFWGGRTLKQLRRVSATHFTPVATKAEDPAAIIFTTGSTGPPKGVLYQHSHFAAQVAEIRKFYEVQPGGIDLAGFPLLAIFNAAMGITTILPDMDFTRPAQADPRNIVEAIRDWNVTQAFGSPALWNLVGQFCQERKIRLPTLRRVLAAGAPVPHHVLGRMKDAIHEDGDVHTPYGATEALPVSSISASEVLGETAPQSFVGAGVCVGRRFPGIEWKVIGITDGPIVGLGQIEVLPRGEIGELIVRGPVVTRTYVANPEANRLHKIRDKDGVWHRMGDLGYLDSQDRFWFCGRKTHRVLTDQGPMYTVQCESIVNQHEGVYRSALVGVGEAGLQKPVMVVELWPEQRPKTSVEKTRLKGELWDIVNSHELTRGVHTIMFHPSLPVDVRHNAKIFREQVAKWAERKLQG